MKEELAPTVADNATFRVDGLGETVAKFATVQAEGGRQVVRMAEHYGLEMITSVGFRVKSPEGVVFRRWANRVLVDMMLQGVSVGRKYESLALEMDRRFADHDSKIIELRKDVDIFTSSSLPPKEKVFVEGKMLDAQVELTRIVKTAKSRIVLVDNYIDEQRVREAIEGKLMWGRRRNGICDIMCGEGRK